MSRYLWTPPPGSSALYPTQHPPSRSQSTRTAPVSGPNPNPAVRPRNKMEAYFMSMDSNFKPTTDEALIQRFGFQGLPEHDIAQAIRDYDARVDKKYAEWCGERGEMNVLGAKPLKGDTTKFQVILIPNTRLAIRVWDGGMEQFHQYFLDFFDIDEQIPVNSPFGYEIHSVATPGMMPMAAGRHPSWENTFGIKSVDILPGHEKFCVPEGSRWCLKRPGQPDFLFAMPLRKVDLAQFALPVAFRPGYH